MRRQATSFFASALDVGRLIAERDGVTLRARGTCMYPAIRHGDVLRIEARTAKEVRVGDIAVCRRDAVLVAHRVVGAGERDGRRFVVTRADRGPTPGDAPAFDDDLLGVVVSITRRGRSVPLDPAQPTPLARRLDAARAWWLEARIRARLTLVRALAPVQDWKLYGAVARRGFALMRPRVGYNVRLPLNDRLGDGVFREIDAAEFDPESAPSGRPTRRWILALHVSGSREPAAWAVFVRDAAENWTVEDSWVRARYRGLGFDAALLRQAETIGCPLHSRSSAFPSGNG